MDLLEVNAKVESLLMLLANAGRGHFVLSDHARRMVGEWGWGVDDSRLNLSLHARRPYWPGQAEE